jgi:HSP20 family protein
MPDERFLHDRPDQPEMELDLESQVDRMVRRWVFVRHTTVWHPPTDVYEMEDRLVVVVEIAGMRDRDFSVTLHGQQLVITGVRQRMTTADCAYYQMEIRFGEFRTEVSLPWPVLREQVSATYRDGFLRIELPRAYKQKVQVVEESGE